MAKVRRARASRAKVKASRCKLRRRRDDRQELCREEQGQVVVLLSAIAENRQREMKKAEDPR